MPRERLTTQEMVEKYPNQWLFIIEPAICEETDELISGIVQVHSPSRDDIHKASKTFIGGAAIRFTGEWTDPKYKRTHRITSYKPKNSK